MRGDRKARRPDHPDGQPAALTKGRAARPMTTRKSTTVSSARLKQPVIIHWLGEMFRPGTGPAIWGNADHYKAMDTAVAVESRANAAKVDGVKVSLLDKEKEIVFRPAVLPKGVRMYTGDGLQLRGIDRRAMRKAIRMPCSAIFRLRIAPAAAAAAFGGPWTRGDTKYLP